MGIAGPVLAAELSGTVLGPGAAPLPGTTVTATNPETGTSVRATSDERGRYRIDVPAGTYEVTAELPSFGTVTRSGVVVGEGGRTGFDIALRPEVAETITVTARKVEENLQDVPIAISTTNADNIEMRNVVLFTQALEEMPNVFVESNLTDSVNISIRGITSNTNNVGIEPAISVYLDENYLPRPAAFQQSLIDIERVEVLRGPQGTAFGKNTIGGAVSIITMNPSTSVPRGTLELATGNYNLKQARGFYGGPISGDKVSGQITFGVRQRDGWFENRTPGLDDLMSEDYVGGRGKLRFTPKASVDIVVSADYSKDESVQNAQDITGGFGYELDGMNGWDRSIATNEGDFFKRDLYGGSLRGDFGLRNHTFTWLTGFRSFESEFSNDQDYSILDIIRTGRREELDFISQELRIASTSEGSFSYLAGVYFSDRDTTGRDRAKVGSFVPILLGIGEIPGYEEWVDTQSRIEEQVFAGFFSGSWAFSERGTFEFGVRYTSEDKGFDYRQDILPFFVAPGVPVGIVYFFAPPVEPIHLDRTDSQPSGDLSLVYRLAEDVNGYLRVARGFKAGGFDSTLASTADPGDLSFDAEKLDAYELGVKSLLAGGTVQLNGAVYYMDYQDKQEQFFDGTSFHTSNAAAVESKGFDLELKWIPASGLEISATGGYTDATYTDYYDEFLDVDRTGNRVASVPEWTGSLAVQYFSPFAGSAGWFIRGGLNYFGDAPTDTANDRRWWSDGATLLNARAGIDFKGGRYSVALWGRNLSNEDYITGGWQFDLTGTTFQVVNQPRMYGVEFRIRR